LRGKDDYKEFIVQSTGCTMARATASIAWGYRRGRCDLRRGAFRGFYLGEDRGPELHSKLKLIQHAECSRGPMRKATALDWRGGIPDGVRRVTRAHVCAVSRLKEYTDVAMIPSLNLVATTLPLNAFSRHQRRQIQAVDR
jgi:hypothetical protein